MEGQKSPRSKLARTASLLRSPTLRSYPHSLSTLAEEAPDDEKPTRPRHAARSSPSFTPFLLSLPLLLLLLLIFLIKDFFPSENLFLASAAVAVASVIALLWKVFSFGRAARRSGSVQWFIGDEDRILRKGRGRIGRIVRERVEFYGNGDVFEGEFHQGKCNGSGVYRFFGKGGYEGDWVDGKYDGYGVESWARGSRYRGQYRQGLRHGFGTYRFYNGDGYAGEWLGGQSHGSGVQTCSDGSCYAGQFKCGVKHGLGCYSFRNGDRYSGEYFGDKIHGFGVYRFANGHCYEGSWHEGRRQGFGTYTFRNGEMRSGEWDCGVLKTPLLPSDLSVQRAIQAARKAAENANLLPRVDDQVNKAVAAANRAATAARVAAIKAVQNHMDGKFCDPDV
ncbi:junctophilin-3-like [Phoenix dactylifera]|uniref:Junctophilin-3-like n=1 Tax=Phoenix dactylifera TaxID=42345 RepID=A0A8B7BNQ7_PHODC|nr:junctophilin-3-like [Phoenix dactylifera]